MNSNQIVQELVKPAFCMRFMIKLALAIYCLHLYTHVFDCLDTISANEQIKNKNSMRKVANHGNCLCYILRK